MTGPGRPETVAVLALLALFSFVDPASAQGFRVRLERGELGVDGRGLQQVDGDAIGGGTSDFQQWFRLPISGYVFHPGIMRFSASVRPLFGQHGATTLERKTTTRDVGLDLSATLFQERRIVTAVQSTRAMGSGEGAFGTRNEFKSSSLSWTAFIRDRYFPTTVSYTSRAVRDLWTSAYTVAPVQRDQDIRTMRMEIRNKKLNTLVERAGFDDRRTDDDYQSWNAQLRHRMEWGKASSMVSGVNFFRRTGASPIVRSSWSEQAQLAHTREVVTNLRFARQTWGRSGQNGRNISYGVGTSVRPSFPIEGELNLSGQHFASGLGTSTSRYRIAPSARYQQELPLNARLTFSGSVGAERLSRELPSDTWIDVIEEAHTVDETRVFTLEHTRVDRETVEIWDEARSLRLVAGTDYWIVETGDLLDIQILPGARVEEAEVVLVTYRFQSIAAEGLSLFYANYEAALRLDGFNLRHGRRQRTEEGDGTGAIPGTPNEVDVWYGAGFSRRTRFGSINSEVGLRRRTSSSVDYRSRDARADVSLPRIGSLDTRLRGSTSRTLTADGDASTTSAYGASAGLPLTRTVRLSGGWSGWTWTRGTSDVERFRSYQAQLSWRFGAVNTLFTFDRVGRENGVDRAENRWSFRMVRRF